ncbi:hypothetical protein POSPLADRAFT_1088234, partial [Postia placenta MAD-698-R-SB12]
TTAIIFRLLFPDHDADRKYGMQEARLAQYLAEIIGVSTSPGGRGNALVNWNGENAIGCLGNEVQDVLEKSTSTTENTLSIYQVDALLTELAATCAFSSPAYRYPSSSTTVTTMRHRPRRAILRELFSALSPVEASVATQIILKDLRPLLYPLPDGQTHYTALLLQHNSNALTTLTLSNAMYAWDNRGRFSAAFRVRARLADAALLYEQMCFTDGRYVPLKPRVGVAVQIPKCVKGQGCIQSLRLLSESKKVWAETKYDGERAQIHVEIISGEPQITIYSKSGRESTMDRIAIHPYVARRFRIVEKSLMQFILRTICDAFQLKSDASRVKKNVIVEAEMVAYSDTLGQFWRIRSLIGSTAVGPRHTKPSKGVPLEPEDGGSQCSLDSNASDDSARHLALVFFDVLMLDDASLLDSSYSVRRQTLESIVRVIPGHSMLAQRQAIPTIQRSPNKDVTPDKQLRDAFARNIADHQEGLVLKADEAKYNERQLPWIKLKRDYIPGYGDTVDLVIVGAAWEKERARELRVAPTAYTTFYLGVLSNREVMKADPRIFPHFEVYFTVSYGLSREALEELNFVIKSSDSIVYTNDNSLRSLSYQFNLFAGIPRPTTLLREPLLVEIFGAGFTKAPHNRFYELRFPRLTKVYRASERTWADGMTLTELQEIAHNIVGRDPSDKDV